MGQSVSQAVCCTGKSDDCSGLTPRCERPNAQAAGRCFYSPEHGKWVLVSARSAAAGGTGADPKGVAVAKAAMTARQAAAVAEAVMDFVAAAGSEYLAEAAPPTATTAKASPSQPAEEPDSARSHSEPWALSARSAARREIEDSTDCDDDRDDGFSSAASTADLPDGVELYRLESHTEFFRMTPRAPLPAWAKSADHLPSQRWPPRRRSSGQRTNEVSKQ
mmetsp:Transcript_30973/g.89202  ORF Transcript_30973/g.89202 Transcript_30973/m.89202 type:complete len:220 (+) Transcript_30973:152-811(+)